MKKIIAIAMLLCLFAVAATAESVELNWADFSSITEEVEGDFVTFDEVSAQMWVPSYMLPVELSDENRENGYIAYFTTEDESVALSVTYVDVSGMSLEEYAAALPEYGATEVELLTVNGLPAVSYMMPENDAAAVSFVTEAGYAFEVGFTPISMENADSMWAVLVASIQAA